MSDADDLDQLYKKFRCVLKFIKTNTFDHLKLKYGTELLTDSIIIFETWEKIRNSSKIVELNLAKIALFDIKQRNYIKNAVKYSEYMKIIDFSKNSINDGDDLEIVHSNSGWNLDHVQLNADPDLLLAGLSSRLDSLASILPIIKSIKKLFIDTLILHFFSC